MPQPAHLAIDLGAESGRAHLGVMEGSRLAIGRVHRFAHEPLRLPSGLHWNITGIWRQVIEAVHKAAQVARDRGLELRSIGVDTWGVDFGFMGRGGELLGLPHAYRDPRNAAAMERALARISAERLFRQTGIQILDVNTIFQLCAVHEHEPALLDTADRLLLMPDLLHFFLSGAATNERTIASTTQMMAAGAGEWAMNLIQQLGLPTHVLKEVAEPCTRIGTLLPELAAECGLGDDVAIIAPPAHDTACAVMAVPAAAGSDWCYLSSGTWSLLGAVIDEPLLSQQAFEGNFTNEAGADGRVRFHRNLTGLWLVQQCRAAFQDRFTSYDYARLTQFAAESPPFATLIDPNHAMFAQPGDMPARIERFARETSQPQPREPGEYIRCCLESLALSYRRTLRDLEATLGRNFDRIHIVGGGCRNDLLNQMTADATAASVLAGPEEATAAGNILAQRIGCGELASFEQAREVSRASAAPRRYDPREIEAWDAQEDRFAELCSGRAPAR